MPNNGNAKGIEKSRLTCCATISLCKYLLDIRARSSPLRAFLFAPAAAANNSIRNEVRAGKGGRNPLGQATDPARERITPYDYVGYGGAPGHPLRVD